MNAVDLAAPQLVLLGCAGAVVGAVGTLVGTGGGWAMVPLFIMVLGLPPRVAAATSLTVVFLNALSGSVAYLRQGRVLLGLGVLLAVSSAPGAVLGSWLSHHLDTRGFGVAFAAFLLVTAGFLWRGRDMVAHAATVANVNLSSRQKSVAGLVSVFVGVLSSLLGVGGGVVHVPFLVLVLHLPLHVATATSQFVLAITALVGVVPYAMSDAVVWPVAGSMGVGAVAGAQVGAWLSSRMDAGLLQRVLAALLMVFSGVLVWRTF